MQIFCKKCCKKGRFFVTGPYGGLSNKTYKTTNKREKNLSKICFFLKPLLYICCTNLRHIRETLPKICLKGSAFCEDLRPKTLPERRPSLFNNHLSAITPRDFYEWEPIGVLHRVRYARSHLWQLYRFQCV